MPPKRPRPHQLESESRIAFHKKLPSQWLFQDIDPPEYGLDGRVEIFDKADLATGLMFFVQLKGTDERELKGALAVQIEIPTCEYYRSLDLPVLIVRYHAPTNKLYVKWFHAYDPYYGRNAKKSITFRLSVEDDWQEETAARLVSDLEAFRQLRSPHLAFPIKFTITLKEQYIHGGAAAQIELEIRKALDNFSRFIAITNVLPTKAHGSIMIGSQKTEIYLASGNGFTIHTSKKHSNEINLSKFAYDILIGIAIALLNAGHSNIAARIFAEFGAISSIISQPEIVLIAVRCMIMAHRVTEALQLSEKLLDTESFLSHSKMLALPALLHSKSLSKNEHKYLQIFLERYVERVVQFGDYQKIATAHYNLGNYFASRRYQRLAFHHYRQAAKYHSEYLERPYFCRELAGILFESKRYSLAAKFYERALSFGEEGVCRALYADALMFAGKYRESQQAFYAYLASSLEFVSEWRLKACVLVLIYSLVGCGEQKRQTEAAIKLSIPDEKLSSHEYRQKLKAALRHDALCSYTWFNLGVLESQTSNQETAFISFLIAALTNRYDVEAWGNAIAIGINQGYNSLVSDMLLSAHHCNENKIMGQIINLAQHQSKVFPAISFINTINEIISNYPQQERPFKLRLIGEGIEVYTFNFGGLYGNECIWRGTAQIHVNL